MRSSAPGRKKARKSPHLLPFLLVLAALLLPGGGLRAAEADPTLVTAIQSLLTQQGYRPGPADGRMKAATAEAIRRYQAEAGLPADGRPTPALLDRLAGEAGAVSPAAGVPLIGTTWEFMDAGGAMFRARFEPDGTLHGPGEMRFWRWDLTTQGLRIVYDNGMGTRVVRQGRFIDQKWLNGSAEASGGRRWDWVANRVDTAPSP